MIAFDAVSVIPDVFEPYVSCSIMGRAQDKGLMTFTAHDLRRWTHDHYRKVDDAPFGGGQGMLMKPEPIFEAVEELSSEGPKPYVVFFSPAGVPWSQTCAELLAQKERILFVCGRYEGMDERVYSLADEVISLGDYVLTGGELAALVVVDSVTRLIPGVLGDDMSARDESFSEGLLEYAQYTRPAVYHDLSVPDVLLSGDHGAVARWRRQDAIKRTALMRPDLIDKAGLTSDELSFARELMGGVVDAD